MTLKWQRGIKDQKYTIQIDHLPRMLKILVGFAPTLAVFMTIANFHFSIGNNA